MQFDLFNLEKCNGKRPKDRVLNTILIDSQREKTDDRSSALAECKQPDLAEFLSEPHVGHSLLGKYIRVHRSF